MTFRSFSPALLALSLLIFGCVPKKTVSQKPKEKVKPAVAEKPSELSEGEFAVALFEFDQWALTESSRKVLSKNLKRLKKTDNFEIRVEGHSDSLGPSWYNFVLAKKRAMAVRNFYIKLGASPERIRVLNFGEDRLLCRSDSDECQTRNRRVVTKIRKADDPLD